MIRLASYKFLTMESSGTVNSIFLLTSSPGSSKLGTVIAIPSSSQALVIFVEIKMFLHD